MNRYDWRKINIQYVYPAIDSWRKGKLSEAETILLKGLDATSNDGFIALNYGQLLEEMKRFSEAKKMYEIAWSTLDEPRNKVKAKKGLERVASKMENISSGDFHGQKNPQEETSKILR